MSAHTPAPWSVRKNNNNHWGMREVIGPSVLVQGFVVASDVDAAKAQRIEADVLLIAAAWDLLAALANVIADPIGCAANDYAEARAAIARAEGDVA
jgi:hypothetical protein